MSWTEELYRVYENCCNRTDLDEALLPISHLTVNAQIELTISDNGDFIRAQRVDKENAVTVIPVTVDSSSRTSGIFPHPFADKLIYIAGDYSDYVQKANGDFYQAYIDGLEAWLNSEYCHPAVNALYTYLQKGCVMADLVNCGVLELAEESSTLNSGVKIAGIEQQDCFVRIRVIYGNADDTESRTWMDTSLYDSFISFNSCSTGNLQLCYATGEVLPCTYKHPSKIRNAGDKGKLMSSNDESGFAYRGRFDNKEQALSVSYDFSQKMHNALRWLIARQGLPLVKSNKKREEQETRERPIGGSLVYVAWESALNPIPDVKGDCFDSLYDFGGEGAAEEYPDTVQAYKSLLSKSIFGYKQHLARDSKAMIMMLDSATTGRLSISMHTELASSDLLDSLEKWHTDTAWMRFDSKLKKSVINSFGMHEIINCAFGTEKGNFIDCAPEVIRDNMLRLIPCATQGRRVPADIVNSLVRKASNPLTYDNGYNFNRVLEVACGMLRKTIIEQKGKCEMALDTGNTDRSYLFGRLLAVADKAESDTYEKGEGRTTNAKRYWSAFSARPYQTWKIIEERLRLYLDKLGGGAVKYNKLIDEIMTAFVGGDFESKDKLQPIYLLGYHCQMNSFYTHEE